MCLGYRYQCASARSWHILASPWIQRCAGPIGRHPYLKLGLPATENEVKVDPLLRLLLQETNLLCRQRRRTCVEIG